MSFSSDSLIEIKIVAFFSFLLEKLWSQIKVTSKFSSWTQLSSKSFIVHTCSTSIRVNPLIIRDDQNHVRYLSFPSHVRPKRQLPMAKRNLHSRDPSNDFITIYLFIYIFWLIFFLHFSLNFYFTRILNFAKWNVS